MGETYTICDPYLYTLGLWLEDDSVDVSTLPKVMAHRKRKSGRRFAKSWKKRGAEANSPSSRLKAGTTMGYAAPRFGWSSSRPVSSISLRSQIEPGSICARVG
jgi:hypothetical protein